MVMLATYPTFAKRSSRRRRFSASILNASLTNGLDEGILPVHRLFDNRRLMRRRPGRAVDHDSAPEVVVAQPLSPTSTAPIRWRPWCVLPGGFRVSLDGMLRYHATRASST